MSGNKGYSGLSQGNEDSSGLIPTVSSREVPQNLSPEQGRQKSEQGWREGSPGKAGDHPNAQQAQRAGGSARSLALDPGP